MDGGKAFLPKLDPIKGRAFAVKAKSGKVTLRARRKTSKSTLTKVKMTSYTLHLKVH